MAKLTKAQKEAMQYAAKHSGFPVYDHNARRTAVSLVEKGVGRWDYNGRGLLVQLTDAGREALLKTGFLN